MSDEGLRAHTGAIYRIEIRGLLDDSWSARLGGLSITSVQDLEYGDQITTLEGSVPDQAALLGILNTLYNLKLPLIAVVCVAVP
jgi:hypothetical protein